MGLPVGSPAELGRYLHSLHQGELVTRDGLKRNVPSFAGASRTQITALVSYLAQEGIVSQGQSGNIYNGGIERLLPVAAPVNHAYPVPDVSAVTLGRTEQPRDGYPVPAIETPKRIPSP